MRGRMVRYRNPFGIRPFRNFLEEFDRNFELLSVDNIFENMKKQFETSFPIRMTENDKEIIVTAEIPGVNKDDINIAVEDNKLTISFKKEIKNEEKDNKVHFSYIEYGEFSETIDLGNKDLDIDNIEAQYENGVLKIKIPKKVENTKVKKIKIK